MTDQARTLEEKYFGTTDALRGRDRPKIQVNGDMRSPEQKGETTTGDSNTDDTSNQEATNTQDTTSTQANDGLSEADILKKKLEEVEKRLSDKDRYITELKKTQPKAEDVFSAETLEKVKKDNPEQYKLLVSIARQEAASQDKEFADRLEKFEQEKAALTKREAQATIVKEHPDAFKIQGTKEFKTWLEAQEPSVKNWFIEETATAGTIVKGLTLYKVESGIPLKPVDAKQTKADNATAIPSGKQGNTQAEERQPWSESRVKALKPGEYSKYKKEINEDLAAGRFILDSRNAATRARL